MAHFFDKVYFCSLKFRNYQKNHAMKKITLSLMLLLAFTFSLKAQQFVSTESSNRNVVLEEFTGRLCGYCPDGHVIANQIKATNPDRFWSVNIHSDGSSNFSTNTYPNLNTTKGNQIRAAFGANSFPSGVVNRGTSEAIGRGSWSGYSNQQFSQAAECNVAGRAEVNPYSRVATITVEVYYTGNSSTDENYLTVVMLQDSIWGSQASGSSNPSQWLNGQYCHMHTLRDVITEVMGDPISPTTQGTLVTKTYTYTIPETIGSPNGVAVDINNIQFLAWVSERYQGTPTRPILNANELEIIQVHEGIYPSIEDATLSLDCSISKNLNVKVLNGGTETITSMSMEVAVAGNTYTANWSGNLGFCERETIVVPVELPIGNHAAVVTINQVNGETVSHSKTVSLQSTQWVSHEMTSTEERLKLILMQDKFGDQITWEFVSSTGEVLASGGPYAQLIGSTGTQPHVEYVTVSADDCVRFSIYDSGNNGICCNYGNGYFTLSDSNNNVLLGDQGNGDFGGEFSILISTKSGGSNDVTVGETQVSLTSETEANFVSPLQAYMYPEQVGFVYRKLTSSQPTTVIGVFNEFQKILATVDDLEPETMYSVKAFAVVEGETYYGPEYHFYTMVTGLSELEQTLKLYPNPTSGVLNIQAEGMTGVEVFNAVGQRIMMQEASGSSIQINTEALNNGIYFVRIHANDGAVLNRSFSVAR